MEARHEDDSSGHGVWVDATPFRAHLRHLMSVSGLSSASVALLVGVSPSCTHRLLHGRAGRPLRRISPEVARKLLLVSTSDVRAVRRCTVPAAATVRQLRRLQEAGWADAELAEVLGLSHAGLVALLSGASTTCSQLVALRTAAQVSELVSPVPGTATALRAAA